LHSWYNVKDWRTKNDDIISLTEGYPATMLHHLIASWHFSRERPLSLTDNRMLIISRFLSLFLSLSLCFLDRSSPLLRQSDVNNIAISLSLSLSLSLCSRIDHLPFFMISRSLSLQTVGDRRSFHFGALCWQESFHGYDILREDGTNRVSARSTYSLASSLFFSPLLTSSSLLLQLFSSSPFLVAIISVSPTWSRRLVRRSAAIMTSRGGEYALRRIKIGCIHDCTLHSSTDSRGDRTFAL